MPKPSDKNKRGMTAAGLTAALLLFLAPVFAEETPAAAVPPPAPAVLRSFEVHATSVISYFIDGKKVKKRNGGDQIIYFVDLPNKVVKRIAVYYARKKKDEAILPGLYAKPLEYSLISYKHDFMKDQLIIKAMAQTEGADDGFETLVIGEDFAASSVSARGYFTVTYYERTDEEAMAFKRKRGELPEEEKKEEKPAAITPEDSEAPDALHWFGAKISRFNKWRKQKD